MNLRRNIWPARTKAAAQEAAAPPEPRVACFWFAGVVTRRAGLRAVIARRIVAAPCIRRRDAADHAHDGAERRDRRAGIEAPALARRADLIGIHGLLADCVYALWP